MKLGDFFSTAATCQPVNPRIVQFTAATRGAILPDGSKNPNPGGFVRATVTGALVFLTGEDVADARLETQRALRERFKAEKADEAPPIPSSDDFHLELIYQQVQRTLREWEPEGENGRGKAGAPLFPSVKSMREYVVLSEATRLMEEYNAYVKAEHPEVVDKKTFRGAEVGG